MLDVNKDGHLSEDELFDGLLRRGWNQDELQNLFGTLDLNGDGKITKSEYLDGMSRLLNGKQKVISLPAPTMACQNLSGSKAVLNGESAMCLFFEVPQESANTKATGNAKSHVEFLTNVRVETVRDGGQDVPQLCADGKEMMGGYRSADWAAQKHLAHLQPSLPCTSSRHSCSRSLGRSSATKTFWKQAPSSGSIGNVLIP